MHHQDAIGQLFGIQRAQHVGDVGFQIDLGVQQVGALAQSGQRDGVGAVAGADQRAQRVAPIPGATPGAVNEQVVGHGAHPLRCGLKPNSQPAQSPRAQAAIDLIVQSNDSLRTQLR